MDNYTEASGHPSVRKLTFPPFPITYIDPASSEML
jgi:hypothetical protein